MSRTQIKGSQAFDPDFALQHELNTVKDNNTGLFVPSTMNNKALFDQVRLIQDNNTSGFNPTTMNNKALYDLINSRIYGSNMQYTVDSPFTSTTSTSYIDKLNWTTSLIPPGIYRIDFKLNYTGAAGSTATRFLSRLLIDGAENLICEETNQAYSTGTVGHLLSGYFIHEFTNNSQHQLRLQYCSSSGTAVRIGNAMLFLFRVS